ncbi:MAG: addiction module protein [Proteobacteria bacterium]|nr:addiction module protein [Pseudomonadota bacterium]
MSSSDKVLAAALDLPKDERARIAHELLLSLGENYVGSDEDVAGAWAGEIAKRLQEVRSGTVDLVDLDEVDAYVGQRLDELRR